MVLQELIKKERKEGKLEGMAKGKADAIIELLPEEESVSAELKELIYSISDMDLLSKLLKLASKSKSIASFEKEMNQLLGR